MAGSLRIRANKKACRDCQACVLGCSLYHDRESSVQTARLKITKDMALYEFDISICRHCADPKCMAACPAGAMYVDERGVVMIIDEKCTRCGKCQKGCPFGALYYDGSRDRYIKCDLCSGREDGPLCVQLCPTGALSLAKRREK
jgi:Fe-S-cluster-containing hydrogenase component 2